MTKDKTYISNRQARIISEKSIVVNYSLDVPDLELAVFEVECRYVGYAHRMKIKTEYDARWRAIGNTEWNYRSIHRSARAALREILLLRDNSKELTFSSFNGTMGR